MHYPAGGWRSKREGAILKSMGARAGVPDVLIVKNGHLYALELKAPGGRVSNTQSETMLALSTAGATVAVAVGLDQALAQLEEWQLLKPAY
jgi:VRR-NUC domain